ncbi:MAG: helix-turn-helix domain-containing protein [Coriobacteriales bacterium]|jgi:transcriptional regulator with XRE-family HTH domain
MATLKELKQELMEDPEFAQAYEEIQPELAVMRAIASARAEQNLTQKQVSERTGIAQAEISKLENGTRNPSIRLLQRLADGLGYTLRIEFVPKGAE